MGFTNDFPYTDFHEMNLDWILNKIKEFQERIDSFEDTVLKRANAYTDSEILKLSQKISAEFVDFTKEITDKIANIDSNYKQFVTYVNNRITLMENELVKMNDYIQTILKQANEYTRQAIINNNAYIICETTKALSTVKVINYFTGERVSIQEMFNYLCQFHLENAINYTVMASREKTYTEFNNLNMTYTDLALNGGTLYN